MLRFQYSGVILIPQFSQLAKIGRENVSGIFTPPIDFSFVSEHLLAGSEPAEIHLEILEPPENRSRNSNLVTCRYQVSKQVLVINILLAVARLRRLSKLQAQIAFVDRKTLLSTRNCLWSSEKSCKLWSTFYPALYTPKHTAKMTSALLLTMPCVVKWCSFDQENLTVSRNFDIIPSRRTQLASVFAKFLEDTHPTIFLSPSKYRNIKFNNHNQITLTVL